MIRYIFFITVAFFLCFSATGFSQSQEQPQGGGEKKVEEKAQQPRHEADVKTVKPDEKEWPPPFEPSEKVGADSVISFPTDI